MKLEDFKRDIEAELSKFDSSWWLSRAWETYNYFLASFTTHGIDISKVLSIPKKYNNLWSLKVERAVRETLENHL